MKKLISVFSLMVAAVSFLAMPAMATDRTAENVTFYEDGSYAVIAVNSDGSARANASKEKSYTYYNSQGQRCFAYVLYASFTYDGVTSQANSVDYKVIFYRQGWNLSTHSEYVSGNTAYGRATFTGPDGQSRTASLALSCDKNGRVT